MLISVIAKDVINYEAIFCVINVLVLICTYTVHLLTDDFDTLDVKCTFGFTFFHGQLCMDMNIQWDVAGLDLLIYMSLLS